MIINTEMLLKFGITFGCVFLLSVLLLHWLIPILKSKKVGQKILTIGPRWHMAKEGTPTMGGIGFIVAILVTLCGVSVYYFICHQSELLLPLALTIGLATVNGLVGFIDDSCKLQKKVNEGLKAYQKFLLQVAVAAVYLFAMSRSGFIHTALELPFCSKTVELGIWYYVLSMFLIVGIVNGANLTDGIDGLAAGVASVIGSFFAVCAFKLDNDSLALSAACIIGATLGFLVYNFNPACVFMGDTGSLFLGGLVTGCAFMINKPLIILLCGSIYVIEALSVILQVLSVQLFGKRLFRMAPIHHHFEKIGWSEKKIFFAFALFTALSCVVGWFSMR